MSKLRRELSSDGEDALRALHIHGNKRLNDMVEWIALDTFRMRKAEETDEGLEITEKTFQIKEVQETAPPKPLPGQIDLEEQLR